MQTAATLVSALLMAAAASGPALAQTKLSPGLWESTMTMKDGGQSADAMAKMQKQLESLPPEQRKMMADAMAQRGVALGGPGGRGFKVCISKEQAERGDVPDDDAGRCTREALQRSGDTIRFRFRCTNPPSTGEGEFTVSSDKAYNGRMVVETTVQGAPRRTEMQQSGRWLSADCGTLQPRAPAK